MRFTADILPCWRARPELLKVSLLRENPPVAFAELGFNRITHRPGRRDDLNGPIGRYRDGQSFMLTETAGIAAYAQHR